MISFREYLQEELHSTSMTLYGRCDWNKLIDVINYNYKNVSHVHFSKYDDGMYCFSNLQSALNPDAAIRYGDYILKFTIPGGVKNFFYTSYDAYKNAVNPNAKDGEYADNVPFIDEQLKRFGLNKKKLLSKEIYPASRYKYKSSPEYEGVYNFQDFVRYLEKYNLIPGYIKGIEYYSKEDKNAFIVFDNKAIVPLEVLDTKGNLIKKIDKQIKEVGYKNSRNNLSVEKINNLKYKFVVSKSGDVNCFKSDLTSLNGAPEKVRGSFNCNCNNLTSLKGAPKEVYLSFHCNQNDLTSLNGGPKEVGGNFSCTHNNLTSIKGAPEKVGGHFDCSINLITSLNGGPKEVGGGFYCIGNNLTSLSGGPEKVGGQFDCSANSYLSKEEIIKYSKTHPDILILSDYGRFKGGVKQ